MNSSFFKGKVNKCTLNDSRYLLTFLVVNECPCSINKLIRFKYQAYEQLIFNIYQKTQTLLVCTIMEQSSVPFSSGREPICIVISIRGEDFFKNEPMTILPVH